MSSLYDNIKELCDEKGIKPGKMCNDLGLSRSFMTELKSGRKKGATGETLSKIADYFSVTTDRLLYGKSNDRQLEDIDGYLQRIKDNPGHRLLFDKTKDATPEQLQAIVSMIDAFMKKD